MSTYKLIQDIEAEDHILGPLSLRQFIFALISVFLFYICFLMVTKHVLFMLAFIGPPALFFGFFALPFGRDQPTEVWFLAKLRFWFKPRIRIWDQSGIKELVTITVPKKVEVILTNGLSQYEVNSRLNALANTLDSRGWVVKNSNAGSATAAFISGGVEPDTERLLDVNNAQPIATDDELPAGADILDEKNSLISQQFDQMIDESTIAHRKQLIDQMNSVTPPQAAIPSSDNQWFMPNVDNSQKQVSAPDVAAQDETADEAAMVAQLKAKHHTQQVYFGNLRTINPIGAKVNATTPTSTDQSVAQPSDIPTPTTQSSDQTIDQSTQQPQQPSGVALTVRPDPAILNLANNNDLNVETIAREAKRAKENELGQDEVVISLH